MMYSYNHYFWVQYFSPWKKWIVTAEWLTDERRLALFAAGITVKYCHHHYLRHAASMMWTWAEFELKLCWMKPCSSDNHYISHISDEIINLCWTSVFLSIPPYRRFLMFATQSLIMEGYMFPWKGKIRWRGDDNSLQIMKILYQKVRLMIISTKLLKENKHESLF